MKPGGPEVRPPSDGRTSDEQITNALVPALHILDGFNHRNKNQHRVAHWWTQFNLLRRSVRRLNDALILRLRSSAQQAQSFKKQKPQEQQKTSKVKNALHQDITARARILVDTTIPSSFLVFTQLTADNQHAALGLALLGVLASINSAVAHLVPRQPEKSKDDTLIVPPIAPPVAAPAEDKKQPDAMGLGVAISRDQLHLATNPQARRAASDVEEAAKPSLAHKKRKLAVPTAETLLGKPAKNKKLEKQTAKKKSKKGDEFSDLFSSLM